MHPQVEQEFDPNPVLAQLERMLSSPQFHSSRRSSNFFRYVVLQTLQGAHDSLKERTIGVEVFHRDPAFDTATDCTVRVSATEVRKRIAQYYQEEGRENELRIDLPPGSYSVRFRGPAAAVLAPPETHDKIHETHDLVAPVVEVKPEEPAPSRATAAPWKKVTFATVALVLLSIAALVAMRIRFDTGTNRFWGPFFDSPNPVLICVGTVEPTHIAPDFRKQFTPEMADTVNGAGQASKQQTDSMDWPALTLTDAVEATRSTDLLTQHGRRSQLRSSENVTLTDLRGGPAILVGVLENPWTLQLLSKLRFRPRMDYVSQTMWIEDAQHPERRNWSTPWGLPFTDSSEDYALVTRTRNPLSGQVTVVLGGLAMHSSQAAGEFATNPASLNKLSPALRDPNKSVQIVLKINVIKGEAGPPQIVAEYYW